MPSWKARIPAGLAVALACATPGGSPVVVDAGADFGAYQTFDFVPVPAQAGAALAPTLTYYGIDGVLARNLGTVGLVRAVGGTPDLLFAYFAGGSPVDTEAWGYSVGAGATISVSDVSASSLVVDAVDARTRKLVWRGVAQGALAGAGSADPAVRQMLAFWPARSRY
ncbi:MAG TPA: DUF4136 domain-containing protein [Anaeromyxobacteraceae bacterium]|nr:DUF4136 domain-containing protein [Anaeromyxobacteraceae bacterium]